MVKPVFKSTSVKAKPTAYTVEVAAETDIFAEGELGTEMFIIQAGKVEILKGIVDGQQRRIALLGQGDFFGEMSVLEDLPRTAAARAVTDCRLLRISGSTFDQMLRKNPEIAVRMMRKLSRRLREADRMLRETLGSEQGESPEMPPLEEPEEGVAVGPERLVHEATGTELHLAVGDETTVGRRDPVTGINPDIDLTPIDTQRSISRRHAKLFRRGDTYYVREEIGTMNGTFVNGERVETGIPVEFHDGDEVRFGLVKTVFRR